MNAILHNRNSNLFYVFSIISSEFLSNTFSFQKNVLTKKFLLRRLSNFFYVQNNLRRKKQTSFKLLPYISFIFLDFVSSFTRKHISDLFQKMIFYKKKLIFVLNPLAEQFHTHSAFNINIIKGKKSVISG